MPKNTHRKLSDLELSYLDELKLYDKVLETTALVSANQHNIQTDGRGVRAVKIFTRQTLTGLSLSRLLPRPRSSKSKEEDFWDICSIASLTRNIVEGYLSLHYFGIEKISDSEAELRFFILQLHRNVEWYNIRKAEMDEVELRQFEEGIAKQKLQIKNHINLPNLSEAQRKRAIQGAEIYKTKSDFEGELSVCTNLRKYYRILSNLVHPLPLSIERTDNNNGRGLGSEADISYCLMCVALARSYLTATTIGVIDHFPNELGVRFKKEKESIQE
jgi:hypothetical protein